MFYSRVHVIAALLALLVACTSAAKPTSFCKCTCGSNSTIVPLDAQSDSHALVRQLLSTRQNPLGGVIDAPTIRDEDDEDEEDDGEDKEDKEDDRKNQEGKGDKNDDKDRADNKNEDEKKEKKPFHAKTCNDCNRQFCIDNALPSCTKEAEKDIFTQCFQRDSAKDQAVVFIFIIATGGLLIWALARPYIGGFVQKFQERRSYIPISGNGESND